MNEHVLSPLPYTENALDPVITAHTIVSITGSITRAMWTT